jgi:hypothetical protein
MLHLSDTHRFYSVVSDNEKKGESFWGDHGMIETKHILHKHEKTVIYTDDVLNISILKELQ